MQARRTIAAVFAAMSVFFLWTLIIQPRFFPQLNAPPPRRDGGEDQRFAEDPLGGSPATTTATAEGSPTGPPASTRAAQATIQAGDSAAPVRLGSTDEDGAYPMMLELVPEGAGVATVELRGHYAEVREQQHYPLFTPVATRAGDPIYSFVTPRLVIPGVAEVNLEHVLWKVVERPAGVADAQAFEATVKSVDGQPLARVIKTYTLPVQSPEKQTFDLKLTLRVENLSDKPFRAVLVQRGPIGFRKEDARSEDRQVLGARWQDGAVTVKAHARKEIAEKKIRLGEDKDDQRIAWAAEANKYFTAIMAPAGRDGADAPVQFSSVDTMHLTDFTDEEGSGDLTFEFVTQPMDVQPAGGAEVAFDVYLGPKSKTAFQSVETYEKRDYYAVIRWNFYFCAPAWLVAVMMGLLNLFHKIPPHNYGLAIIMLVLVVKGLLHPITKKSQVNMMKMQKDMARLQPKIQAVKEKYANDRTALNTAMMAVYKEEGVNPAGSILTCLPMMLQIPIWGALWQALASTIEMRHAGFDGYWIRDLAAPDALVKFKDAITIPLLGWLMGGPVHSFNLLPVLLGISQLLQAKYMPRGNPATSTSANPDQLEQQRRMMMFMSVFFVFMLYNAPSGLCLYIMASNLFGIVEQLRIRKHLQDLDARRAAEPPPVTRKGSDASKGGPQTRHRGKGDPQPEPKKGRLQRWWEDMQKTAEEAKRIQSRKRQ